MPLPQQVAQQLDFSVTFRRCTNHRLSCQEECRTRMRPGSMWTQTLPAASVTSC
jgi:hypothetical protein